MIPLPEGRTFAYPVILWRFDLGESFLKGGFM